MGVVTVVVVPVGRVAAGRKMGRLRRRLEVTVVRRRRRRREGRQAAGGRRPRQLLLEGHRLRLRLDREGRDVAPDREVRAVEEAIVLSVFSTRTNAPRPTGRANSARMQEHTPNFWFLTPNSRVYDAISSEQELA